MRSPSHDCLLIRQAGYTAILCYCFKNTLVCTNNMSLVIINSTAISTCSIVSKNQSSCYKTFIVANLVCHVHCMDVSTPYESTFGEISTGSHVGVTTRQDYLSSKKMLCWCSCTDPYQSTWAGLLHIHHTIYLNRCTNMTDCVLLFYWVTMACDIIWSDHVRHERPLVHTQCNNHHLSTM